MRYRDSTAIQILRGARQTWDFNDINTVFNRYPLALIDFQTNKSNFRFERPRRNPRGAARLADEYVLPLANGAVVRVVEALPEALGVEEVLARRHPGPRHPTEAHGAHVVAIFNFLAGRPPESIQNGPLFPQRPQAIGRHVLRPQEHHQVGRHEAQTELAVAQEHEDEERRQPDGVVAQDDRGVQRFQGLQRAYPAERQHLREQVDEDPLRAHVVSPRDERVQRRRMVVFQPLLQSEHQQHERHGDDEGDRLRPFQHYLRGRHGHVLDVAVLGHVDVRRPVLFLDQFFDVRYAVCDDVVEHEGVEAGDAFLRFRAPHVAQQHAVAHHEEHQLQERNIFQASYRGSREVPRPISRIIRTRKEKGEWRMGKRKKPGAKGTETN